ncbi:NAD(P)-binding protein [Dichomitus squalens LYAD-421 SS1]|uniref:NAD(P)-binding protein n=1 Tax=Dichomitus squalens TaxID=114155 RepID=A0A4Q9N8P7_9APHY|nr:NAD(P)-binding protein [Dichomitus squalens LYAD-421 SS1]EJF66364.1 NAD(P)-binding protein [Dichomitus squalens LYAD-421 SS1]TBU35366.1 NAD(P)-binding protein [Dichomitus squalens]TBU53415.1 NAD(P)-binding protein [Dichomitus squalens]
MTKFIAVCGATGNQGGSVARLLLQHPDAYRVRALTRDPQSTASKELARLGAEVVKTDLTVPSDVQAALRGCWGVFGVTNFYDSKIKDDPGSEEHQGKNLVDAALDNAVQCFVWSTLPSSNKISGGRFISRIYEGKYHVDDYIREKGLPAVFLYTGNFYENMVLRSHMKYNHDLDRVEFHQPVIKETTKLAMLYVQKDLSAVTKAIFDQWELRKDDLNHNYLYAANARVTPLEILASVKKVTGKDGTYIVLPTSGVPDRDIMFQLYNEMGMYGAKELPDENILKLGVQMHGVDDFVRLVLAPHLGLPV